MEANQGLVTVIALSIVGVGALGAGLIVLGSTLIFTTTLFGAMSNALVVLGGAARIINLLGSGLSSAFMLLSRAAITATLGIVKLGTSIFTVLIPAMVRLLWAINTGLAAAFMGLYRLTAMLSIDLLKLAAVASGQLALVFLRLHVITLHLATAFYTLGASVIGVVPMMIRMLGYFLLATSRFITFNIMLGRLVSGMGLLARMSKVLGFALVRLGGFVGIAFTPFVAKVLLAVGVVALLAAGIYAISKSDPTPVFNSMNSALSQTGAYMQDVGTRSKQVFEYLYTQGMSLGTKLKDTFSSMFTGMFDAAEAGQMSLMFQIAWKGLEAGWAQTVNAFTDIWYDFVKVLYETLDGIQLLLKENADAFTTLAVAIGGLAAQAFADDIKGALENIQPLGPGGLAEIDADRARTKTLRQAEIDKLKAELEALNAEAAKAKADAAGFGEAGVPVLDLNIGEDIGSLILEGMAGITPTGPIQGKMQGTMEAVNASFENAENWRKAEHDLAKASLDELKKVRADTGKLKSIDESLERIAAFETV